MVCFESLSYIECLTDSTKSQLEVQMNIEREIECLFILIFIKQGKNNIKEKFYIYIYIICACVGTIKFRII